MFRTDAPGNIAGLYTEGDPSIGQRATQVSAAALNSFQEEIAAVIEAAGIVLNKANNGQLLAALNAAGLFGGAIDELHASPAIASNVLILNAAIARTFKVAFTANITTTTLQNIPASTKVCAFNIKITADGSARTWAWLTGTVIWAGGVAPTFTTTNAKRDWFLVWTEDGGTTWFGAVIGQNY